MSRERRIKQGFTDVTPTVEGLYMMSCNELDYDIAIVEIVDDNGLIVKDPEVGSYPIECYDLTDLLWLRGQN